jgi:hypothetical protein
MNAQECQSEIEKCEARLAEAMLASEIALASGDVLAHTAQLKSMKAWAMSINAYRLDMQRLVN